jgi:amino acid adenylation domain-containing protein
MLIDEFKNLTLADKKRIVTRLRSGAAPASGEQWHPRLLHDERAEDAPFPLTDLQGAYLAAKANPVRVDQAGCHVYLEFDVEALDPVRLEQAWHAVVAAHPMLRAAVMPNGTQRIERQRVLPPFRCEDHTADEAAAERCMDRVREELSHKLYHPGDWPLFEIRVTRRPGGRGRVHVSMDSWIVDARSAEQIYAEWHRGYHDPGRPLEAPRLEFRDFVHSMEMFKSSAGHARCLTYWRNRLADCPEDPALPYAPERQRAAADPRNRRRLACRLPAPALTALREAFATRKVSSTAGMLTLFSEAVRSWSGRRRAGIILTLQNRPPLHADIGRVVGPFTSTALFDADDVAGETLGERLQRYSRQLLDALNHGYVSAVAALRSLGPDRPARSFPIVFTSLLEAAVSDEPSFSRSVGYGVSQTPGTALHCQLRDVEGQLEVTFDCVPSWFAEGFVEEFLDSFLALLGRAAVDPALWEQRSATAVCAPPAMVAGPAETDRPAVVPMSSLQLSYLSERIRQPGKPSGYIFRSFELERMEPARLQAALDGFLADHPMLRAYPTARGAFECSDAVASYPIPVTHVTAEPIDRDAETAQMLAGFAAPPTWPGLRLHLFLRADGSACLLTLLDMAVFDGHAAWTFYAELFGRYRGDRATQESPHWRPYLQARAARPAREVHDLYWCDRMTALSAGPVLPAAKAQASGGTHATVRWTHTVSGAGRLEQLAEEHGVSVESVFLGVFAAVLPQDSGAFALGVADYGPRLHEPALRNGVGDATRFAWGEVSRRQGVPLVELARGLAEQLERDRFHACADPFKGLRAAIARSGEVVPRRVVLTNCLDAPPAHWPGAVELDAASDTPGVDLDNMLHRSADGLTVCWTVRRDACDIDALAECFRAYCTALDALAADPEAWRRAVDGPAARPPAVDRERLEQLARWNATDRPYDREVCVHTLIERQAQATPYAVAVLSDDEVLTYQELDRRANQLAHHLQRQGVGYGALVAVMLSRSHPLITTLLAILKCGAAFIPLNVDDPLPRLTRVLDQAQAGFVVSTREHYGRHADQTRRVVLLDEEGEAIAAQPVEYRPPQPVTSDARAYIIFTSGSTGTPKGVVVRHRPVINLIEWAEREFGFTPDDRVLFVNPLSFDLAIFDVFGLLAYGGSIRIVGDADRSNALAVAQYLSTEPITFWNSAPAYLQMVLPFLQGGPGRAKRRLESLRLVFLSGDWVPLAMPDAVRLHAPEVEVISLGGATEATVWSNYFRVEAIDPDWRSIPYGRPIQNSRYYILDDRLAPVAPGEAGDLFIGGECLSDGYVNEPELTARSFVRDPFHEAAGAVMYRTGDRARFFPDGNIEFLGRIDQQVKLRGYRIELGEVEAALEACGLRRAVVVVREDHGGRRLVGFAAAANAGETGEIRSEGVWAQLKSRLPAYMVPSQVFLLPSLPITTNGKVDRKRLTQDAIDGLLDGATPITPPPANERALVIDAPSPTVDRRDLTARLEPWLCQGVADVLGGAVTSVALDDNLGALGFNSLHYTMLAARLANELGVALNPALFFRYVSAAEIRDYLIEHHAEPLAAVLGPAAREAPAVAPARESRETAATGLSPEAAPAGAIAIIGMAGVMPQAQDLDTFWANLQQGTDCTSEVPRDRWDWRTVDGDPEGPGNLTNVHRAAFMKDVASFDAAFFGISPREAELMDPRQRLLLESVWACLENAAQLPVALRGSRVGIWVGVTGDEYATLSLQPGRGIDRFTLSGVSRTMLANRVSYLFDWHGPSEVIDTACSSSLVAVHSAVRALRAGDCSLAVAGGINVILDPIPHISLSKIGMLAADGRCKTFDSRADGYARGEGVGVVLLKPLADALRDGDPIHAVIRGSAVNHGGRANALTAPNPRAQAQVVRDAIRAAGIDCGRVGYIEAHGTGTALGDPIEVEALKEAFRDLRSAAGQPPATPGSVALSSVKTNIGHLEAAAGIAGLLKAVHCLKHGVLPAALHLETVNANVQLDDSPFYIVREACTWPNPHDPRGGVLPRAAGVSSFGFGGTNAHVVLEQFLPDVPPPDASDGGHDSEHWLVPLSAQSEAQLVQAASSLADFIEAAPPRTLRLGDIAYTLQTARESLQERLLLRAASLAQLVDALRAYAQSGTVPPDGDRGSVKSAPMRAGKPAGSRAATHTEESSDALGRRWAREADIAWPLLPAGVRTRARRIALPTYAFARTRYWLPSLDAAEGPLTRPSVLPATSHDAVPLHAHDPLLDEHRVGGRSVLPAAAYIAWLRGHARVREAGAPGAHGFGDIVWTQPFLPSPTPRTLHLEFVTGREGRTRCRFVADSGGTRVEYCSLELVPHQPLRDDESAAPDVSRHGDRRLTSSECYALFESDEIRLGGLFRTVQELRYGADAGVATLSCSARASDDDARGLLLLDGAFQAIALHHRATRPDSGPTLPFHVKRLQLAAACPGEAVVHLRVRTASAGAPARLPVYDARLYDGDGRLIGWIEACAGRALRPPAPTGGPPADSVTMAHRSAEAHGYSPAWRPLGGASAPVPASLRGLLVHGAPDGGSAPPAAPSHWIVARRDAAYGVDGPSACRLDPCREDHWDRVLVAAGAAPEVIVLDYRPWTSQGGATYQPFDEAFALARSAMRVRQPLTVIALTPEHRRSLLTPAVYALGAFGRALRNESPNIRFCAVEILADTAPVALDLSALAERLARISDTDPKRPVNYRYRPDRAELSAETLEPVRLTPETPGAALPPGSVVLVTGGTGRIGQLLARWLLAQGCRVALLGRATPDAARERMGASGLADDPHCIYLRADVADPLQVEQALDRIRRTWGPLRAVFHAAGVQADGLLLRKDAAARRVALEAKVAGAIVLDEATRTEPLDYFVSFSSLASYLGPVGQTDYSYANAFLNRFAAARNELVRGHQRSGQSCTISWPLWREGGMRMSESERDYIRQRHGMEALETDLAMQCLSAILGRPHEHVALAVGDRERIDRALRGTPAA